VKIEREREGRGWVRGGRNGKREGRERGKGGK
jgi:hypothetical protein